MKYSNDAQFVCMDGSSQIAIGYSLPLANFSKPGGVDS